MELPAQTAAPETKIPAVEAAAPVAPVAKPSDDFDSKFAALARKERQIREREMKFKQEFEPKKGEFDKFSSVRERAKTKDPYAVREALEMLGLSPDEIGDIMLKEPIVPKDPEVLELREQFKQLKEEKERLEKERTTQLEEQNVKEFKSSIKQEIEKDISKFELCSIYSEEAVDMAYSVCEEHFNKHEGEMLPIDKALEKVEAYYEQMLSKVKTSKKLGFAANLDKKDQTQTVTLTNDSQGVASASSETLAGLTGDDRLRALITKYKKG